MKNQFILLMAVSALLAGCASWKKAMVSNGAIDDAIKNAITDFLHTGKFARTDTVFSIRAQHIKEGIWGISISRESNKIAVITDDNRNYSYRAFPTGYIEQNGRLFYWQDSTREASAELISKLYRMNRIDTAIVGSFFPVRERDDSKKAMSYYFCQKNLRMYKKVYTSIAMGWHAVPKLNCPGVGQ
jgi:hypothetical protein